MGLGLGDSAPGTPARRGGPGTRASTQAVTPACHSSSSFKLPAAGAAGGGSGDSATHHDDSDHDARLLGRVAGLAAVAAPPP